MTVLAPPVHSLAQLGELLGRPHALEEIARSDIPVLPVTLLGAPPASLDTERLASRLEAVRAVTIGMLRGPVQGGLTELADAFDILVSTPGTGATTAVETTDPTSVLDTVVEAVAANPQAAVAAAELFRQRAYEHVARGLVLESLTYAMLQSGPEFAHWLMARGPIDTHRDESPPLVVERSDTALSVTLDRPHRANAFTGAMRELLVDVLQDAAADPSIEGVVIRGAGRSFCSGRDLAEFSSAPDPASGHADRVTRNPGWWLNELARDIRVHLHGACVGPGLELAAFAGTVLAAPDTTVRLPAVGMGLVPGAGGTVSIPRRCGHHRAAYLTITGATLDARRALAWGLVDGVVENPT